MWRLRPDALDILEDPGVKRALSRYIRVVRGKAYPKFMIDRILHIDFEQGDDIGGLFALHDRALSNYMDFEKEIDQGITKLDNFSPIQSFLDLKVLLARRIMNDCHFCERRCGVDRLNGKRGYCNSSDAFSVASFFPHLGEEPELVPSGTIFTYGCSIRCIHCQNWDISQWKGNGAYISAKKMADLVEGLKAKGCRNLNMVGGDPTPYASLWLETLRYVEKPIATIWNSNSFYSEETAKLLAGFIDLYLLDFKYGNNDCAGLLSDAPGYWETCTRNHLLANLHGELLIRVLVLPEHNECCTKPILRWIAENLGSWTRVNLMFQYRPEWRARERREMKRRLTDQERKEALRYAREVGLKNLVRG